MVFLVFFCKYDVMKSTCARITALTIATICLVSTIVMACLDSSTGVFWRPYMEQFIFLKCFCFIHYIFETATQRSKKLYWNQQYLLR